MRTFTLLKRRLRLLYSHLAAFCSHLLSRFTTSTLSQSFTPCLIKMSFYIQEHIIPCQHIRQGKSSNKAEEHVLRMSVKQYTPTTNPTPSSGDITIIGAHANGFGKVG